MAFTLTNVYYMHLSIYIYIYDPKIICSVCSLLLVWILLDPEIEWDLMLWKKQSHNLIPHWITYVNPNKSNIILHSQEVMKKCFPPRTGYVSFTEDFPTMLRITRSYWKLFHKRPSKITPIQLLSIQLCFNIVPISNQVAKYFHFKRPCNHLYFDF